MNKQVIEFGGEAVGVVVPDAGRLKFVAVKYHVWDLDSRHFHSADELVAYAGLCPHQQQSGSQLRRSWLSKQGNPHLRKALYFPALTAKQHNPHLRRFAQRLTQAGKAKMVVVAAVMRKLLVLIYTLLKSGHPYDPNYGFST